MTDAAAGARVAAAGGPAGATPPSVGGPVVDVHVHVFSPEVIAERERYLDRDEWFSRLYTDPTSRMVTGERVLEEMDANDVAVSVIFGFAFRDQALCRETNDYVLELVRAYPDRFIGLRLRLARGAGRRHRAGALPGRRPAWRRGALPRRTAVRPG